MERKMKIIQRGYSAWRRHKKIVKWAFWVGVVFFFAISYITMKMPLMHLVRAAGFMLLGLLLPGYLLARSVADEDNPSELYGFSLLFGIGLAIAAFFADAVIRMPVFSGTFFSLLSGPICSIPAAILLIRDIRTGRRNAKSFLLDGRIAALMTIALICAFSATALQSGISAELVGASKSYHDVLWNIANTASLTRGWPVDNAQYLGKALNSNIFANIFRVTAGRFIGSTAAETMFCFSCLYCVPLLVLALDGLGRFYMGGDKKRSFLFVGTFLFVGYISRAVLYMYNVKAAYAVATGSYILTDIANLLHVPNGIDLAVPGCAYLALLVLKVYRQNRVSPALAFAIVLASAVLSGAKYVFAVCLIGGMVGTILFRILQGKGARNLHVILIPLALICLGFGASYFGVVRGGDVYLPAKNCDAVFMDTDADGYLQAKEEYIDYLDKKDYAYLVVSSEEPRESPVVRQDAEGGYYVCGRDITCEQIGEKEILEILQSSDMNVSGLIGGQGGVVYNHSRKDMYNYLPRCYGFIRFAVPGESGTKCCFYGDNPGFYRLQSDEEALSELFANGSDGTEYLFSEGYSSVSINAAAKKTEVYQRLLAGSMVEGKLELLYLLAFIPVYFFLARPATAVPFVMWTVGQLKQFRKIKKTDMLLCGSAVCGLIAFFLLDINGLSQAYFFTTALIFVDLIGVNWLCDNYGKLKTFYKRLLWVLVIIGMCSNLAEYGFQAARGAKRVVQVYTGTYIDVEADEDYITSYELQAMDWLRENTPVDAVVATNRHYKVEDAQETEHPLPNSYSARYYYYSAYCERQMFLGSWAYVARTPEMQKMLEERLIVNDALFSPFCTNKREIMEAHGISYLVASEYVGFGTQMQDEDLECVFRNRDIVIYKLAGSTALKGD